jgi:hypothetical protein
MGIQRLPVDTCVEKFGSVEDLPHGGDSNVNLARDQSCRGVWVGAKRPVEEDIIVGMLPGKPSVDLVPAAPSPTVEYLAVELLEEIRLTRQEHSHWRRDITVSC